MVSIRQRLYLGFGFTKRFGMTWIDYETRDRVLKDSGRWYARTARENGFPGSDADAEE